MIEENKDKFFIEKEIDMKKIEEIINLFYKYCTLYTSFNVKALVDLYDYPCLVIEEGNSVIIPDSESAMITFESILNVYKQVKLVKIDFEILQYNLLSPNILSLSIEWIFYNSVSSHDARFKMSYILQQKQQNWKIITAVRSGWENFLCRQIPRSNC